VERHIAGKRAAGRGHGDVAGSRASGNGRLYECVGLHGEVFWRSVQLYASRPSESLAENLRCLADPPEAVDETHKRAKSGIKAEHGAAAAVLVITGKVAAERRGPVKHSAGGLQQFAGDLRAVTPVVG
jgi:hypothetical protein